MNNQHKNGKDDQMLDQELDHLDQLYHSAENIEPPDLIDQAVLNKARGAVESKNSWLDFGWIHGVTTVALVVLTFSIFTTQRETGEFEPTVGKSVDLAPAKATEKLSADADQVLSKKVISDQDLSGRIDEADGSMPNRAASPAVDTAGFPVSSLPVEAPKKEVQETRTRDLEANQPPIRAPANVAPAPPQSASHKSLPVIVSESYEEETNRSNEAANVDLLREKKQDAGKDQLRSADKVISAPELEDSGFVSQQQLLDKILALKQAGDDRWVKELSDFKKLYPDFPLPQELQN